ncbi:OmpA family protein [Sulfitobacter donghicola]|uniref:OmpA-like domain-containing protein n=1 Tax=Sulfitobacter donghicola DSW-25 = KCTC 12864 = JCM 14565 TaxID=1300350 RepID=A0A073IMV7_9RHOB|nr:OmpA family protein [Sulfitobacter donghicola]KEJ91039.1 hypothetical protein DSW25_00265 [Sulfitobacter donghicola DSW-25 = KCTC 12864 = JCM 14565]KIN67619.1 OmpA domain protein [Sulfitobacter donghicola DSW-25 = KCTC 12864 = JCM 14565]
MRPILIVGVAIATLLTFYSALWFKSETIEADITQRVTDNLAQSDANGIEIDVNGRHVTLSGIVNDETTEAAYLNTADQTYGALGPIDGLTMQKNAGYLKAVKSATGIKLVGTVPSEDARVALLGAAAEGTQGEVIDGLTLGATDGEWTSEAGFGLSQMGQLSSGTLSVTPDSYTLSGTANGDAMPLRSAVADRAGWQTFVSAPTVESDLSSQLSALQADVADRDNSIAEISTERDTLATSLAAMTLARDTAVEQGEASIAALTDERDTAVTDLEALRASLNDTQSDSTTLRGELSDAQTALESATTELADRDATIVALNTQVTDLNANNAALAAELETQKASMSSDAQTGAELRAQIADQTANLAARGATITELEGKLDEATTAQTASLAQIETLSADNTAKDAVISELDAKVAKANEMQTEAEGQIATLSEALKTRDGTVDDLTARLADQSQDTSKLADLSAQIETLETSNKGLASEVAAFGAVIASKDATIADLRKNKPAVAAANVPAGSSEFAAQCSARAGEVLETAQINFSSGTANIRNNSVEVLERLTGIALACADSGLGVEVGGHTDSQGSDEANQALSEQRATAIVKFMSDRGVPADALTAVGYGEAQPIGDNETPEGRAQNRRISFEWQAR